VVNGDSLYIKVNKSDANISSEIELSGTISWVVVTNQA
jgi:hypothetical protein